jgi:hypothetical protein
VNVRDEQDVNLLVEKLKSELIWVYQNIALWYPG